MSIQNSKQFSLTIDVKDKAKNILPKTFQAYTYDSIIFNIKLLEDNQDKNITDCDISILYLLDNEVLIEQSNTSLNSGIEIVNAEQGLTKIELLDSITSNPCRKMNCIIRIAKEGEVTNSTIFSFKVLETIDYDRVVDLKDDYLTLININKAIKESNMLINETNTNVELFKENIENIENDLDDVSNRLNDEVNNINTRIDNINMGLDASIISVKTLTPIVSGSFIHFKSKTYSSARDLIGRSFMIKVKGVVDNVAITNTSSLIINFCEDVDTSNNNKPFIRCATSIISDIALTNGRKVNPIILFDVSGVTSSTVYSDNNNVSFRISTNFRKEYVSHDLCTLIEV